MRPSITFLLAVGIALEGCTAGPSASGSEWMSLFDGQTLTGWEGSSDYFRVDDGMIVGGTTDAPVPRNEFLCRSEEKGDFELRARFRLGEGVNSGIQFRSQRIPGSHEAIGYQADLGDGYWGALYDESRRNEVLAQPDSALIERVLDRDGWNDYAIIAQGRRIRLLINDELTVDYTEPDAGLEQTGRICLQIHSGPPGEARFMDIRLR